MMKKGILGCGWLGKALLEDSPQAFKGTAKSVEGQAAIRNLGADAYVLDIYASSGCWPDDFFKGTDTLYIFVPFERSLSDPWQYTEAIAKVLSYSKAFANIERIIMSSSTSIYPCQNQIAYEGDVIIPETLRAQALLIAEQCVHLDERESAVYRLGGLVGTGRNPATFFKQKSQIDGAEVPVNLIHQDDLVGAIHHLSKRPIVESCINMVSPQHPTKERFYTVMAKKARVPVPIFSSKKTIPYKEVSAQRLISLGYSFIYDNPLDFEFK